MKIAIIGAGPAGIFSSLLLKDFSGEVFLFEENSEIGKKLKLTGGGRMNISNKNFGVEHFFSSEKNLLKNFFKNPITKDPIKIFEQLGVEYFWEGNRAILKSQNAVKEINRLEKLLGKQKNLRLRKNAKVEKIKKTKEGFLLFSNGEKLFFDFVILASGGMYKVGKNESKEQIYKLAKDLDLELSKLSPTLSPLILKNSFKNLAGTSFKGRLKTSTFSVEDDILFTHKGLSGPAVLDFSSYLEGNNFSLSFSLESEEVFRKRFLDSKNEKIKIETFLKNYLPKKLTDFQIKKIALENKTFTNEVSKEELRILIKNIFDFEISGAKKMDYSACWTTKGGISLKEVNPNTLESKKYKNLYFAGELLDIDGLCGGYNISFAAICGKIISDEVLKYFRTYQ